MTNVANLRQVPTLTFPAVVLNICVILLNTLSSPVLGSTYRPAEHAFWSPNMCLNSHILIPAS